MWIASEKLDSFKVMVCIGQEGDWKTIRESGNNIAEREISNEESNMCYFRAFDTSIFRVR